MYICVHDLELFLLPAIQLLKNTSGPFLLAL